ncbi:MAG: type II 3-dehydroquinate dehydratase [Corynebacterium sp.]|uniref:type II 3-dehydroquinate dehydratase n=1 Tax=Corynebacterium sp. TaxID=1720 RepID=UPI0026DEBC87|nr:type II 3-dehydroquinate dehydratase [Corynebacterium sp.]MDO5670244.1 type II 3-dehydroquinate dehydratase [Corynebacterium sp.]
MSRNSRSLRMSDTVWTIGIIDGPNMSQLGKRDPTKYGTITWAQLEAQNQTWAEQLGIRILSIAANEDGEIIDWIHTHRDTVDGWIVNPAGMQTYAEGLRQAFEMSGKPYAETHFANTVRHFAQASPHVRLESGLTSQAQSLVMGLRQHSYLTSLVGLTLHLDEHAQVGED